MPYNVRNHLVPCFIMPSNCWTLGQVKHTFCARFWVTQAKTFLLFFIVYQQYVFRIQVHFIAKQIPLVWRLVPVIHIMSCNINPWSCRIRSLPPIKFAYNCFSSKTLDKNKCQMLFYSGPLYKVLLSCSSRNRLSVLLCTVSVTIVFVLYQCLTWIKVLFHLILLLMDWEWELYCIHHSNKRLTNKILQCVNISI